MFRRIHGRIVPIKNSDSTKERAKGVAQVAAGVAAAAGIAYVGAKIGMAGKLQAAKSFAISTRTLNIAHDLPFNRLKKSVDAYNKSRTLLDIASYAGKAAPLIGGSIAGAGAYKIFSGKSKKSKDRAQLVSGAAGAATFALARKITLKIAFPFIKG